MFGLVALLGACGRLGFETAGDGRGSDGPGDMPIDGTVPVCTTVVHDEDGDGIDDVCDVCPHVADATQGDVDGDRVGDVCDPEPAIARQRIVVFDPFTSLAPAWTRAQGSEAVVADMLVLSAVGSSRRVSRPMTVAHDTFIVGGTSGARGSGVHLFAIRITPLQGPGAFYCEMYDNGTQSNVMFTYTLDDVSYTSPSRTTFSPRFANGAGTFMYEVSSANGRCAMTWTGASTGASAPRPAGIAAEELDLYAQNVDIRLAYFLQIRTDD